MQEKMLEISSSDDESVKLKNPGYIELDKKNCFQNIGPEIWFAITFLEE